MSEETPEMIHTAPQSNLTLCLMYNTKLTTYTTGIFLIVYRKTYIQYIQYSPFPLRGRCF